MSKRILFACLVPLLSLTAAAQTVTRFEQSDPRITYTGVWYPNTNSLESNGTAILANLKGSQVIVNFNGTGISWIGASDYYSGICYLTLDGLPITVDTSNPSGATLYKYPLYTIRNLAPGPHRMTIEVIHSHDATTNASWIWVDAFDVENGTLIGGTMTAGEGTIDQGDPAVNYSGHWFQNNGSQHVGGTVNLAVDTGSKVDVTFNGTSITWLGYRDEYSGIAQVFVDGALQNTVDTYLTPAKSQSPVYTVSGLSPGVHTLSIAVTGTKNPASGLPWIWVDAFRISGSVAVAPPAISAGGIVSAASFAPSPNNQVAPGGIVSVFGQNFIGAGSANASTLPLPTQLGAQNATITACGKAMPLYSVFPDQINAQVPLECATSGTVTATITVGSQSGTQTFTVAPAAPGIFTVNGTGAGDGVILHGDGTLVSPAKPAVAGEQIVIYAAGLGATTPAFATGAAATQVNTTVLPVTVTIGGKDSPVTYKGLTQGLVGLYQINTVVPGGITGSQPVVVTAGGSYVSRTGVTTSVR